MAAEFHHQLESQVMSSYGELLTNFLRMSLSEETQKQEGASSSTSTSNVTSEEDRETARPSSGNSAERTASDNPEEHRSSEATGTSPAHATHEDNSKGMPSFYLGYLVV